MELQLNSEGMLPENGEPHARLRLAIVVRGAVQGVGFRPFVYRIAGELGLTGWVRNGVEGVTIEVEGAPGRIDTFFDRLSLEHPPHAIVHAIERAPIACSGSTTFEIITSDAVGAKTMAVLPDIATCTDCLREVLDPGDRRYRYPFTNCTNCGPRYTIVEALPYDRSNTTMKDFELCERCRREYEDPSNRRFHAQPTACPECGPQLTLARSGRAIAHGDDALVAAGAAIRAGNVVAVKGLGGYHLVVDATDEAAVMRLRTRKHREAKPFALMYPSIEVVETDCFASPLERRLLMSAEAPIVLLRRRGGSVAPSVAPGNPHLGVMLPCTPLHHLLMLELGAPIVATSGNRSDEPICIDEAEAEDRLDGVADCFLHHDRPIARPVDDSIAREVAGRPLLLRRARGYAPLPICVDTLEGEPSTLAVGGHLKNTIAMSIGEQVFISQHIGDMDTVESCENFERRIADFKVLYDIDPARTVCDMHPDYHTSRYARSNAEPVTAQHHYAHVLSCMADARVDAPVLGVSWDGTGYGTDATVWGGEFIYVGKSGFRRVAHLRQFRLPGGEGAVRESRRSAAGVLHEIFGADLFEAGPDRFAGAFTAEERRVILSMLDRGVNAPVTSSAGRLFDAVAALLGFDGQTSFEGQAAMSVEFLADGSDTKEAYASDLIHAADGHMVCDWEPLMRALLVDVRAGVPLADIAAKFHNGLADLVAAVAATVGERRVVLTGGCFQNPLLTERTICRLRAAEFDVYWHERVPPNDGGIALGQVIAAARAGREQ